MSGLPGTQRASTNEEAGGLRENGHLALSGVQDNPAENDSGEPGQNINDAPSDNAEAPAENGVNDVSQTGDDGPTPKDEDVDDLNDDLASYTSSKPEVYEPIRYTVEFYDIGDDETRTFDLPGPIGVDDQTSKRPPVMEVTYRRYAKLSTYDSDEDFSPPARGTRRKPKLPPAYGSGLTEIKILSPVVMEALRCVVDVSPLDVDLVAHELTLRWPYTLIIHYDDELKDYASAFAEQKCSNEIESCRNHDASEAIAVVQEFVYKQHGDLIAEERARHKRGRATFNMLWLLFKAGTDVYCDEQDIQEYSPFVVQSCTVRSFKDGRITNYDILLWNLGSDTTSIGPVDYGIISIQPFAGEKKISDLRLYPCEFANVESDPSPEIVKQNFIDRGKLFLQLRQGGLFDFNGLTTTFPRRHIIDLVMVDPLTFEREQSLDFGGRKPMIPNFESETAGPPQSCCASCEKLILERRKPFRFAGYAGIKPTQKGVQMTNHQYFLCDKHSEAFVMKQREWRLLHVTGFSKAKFDKRLISSLVLNPETKQTILSLTKMYINGLQADEVHAPIALSGPTQQNSSPSVDMVMGKGEGLIFLLHGKPGVGKTFTAECVAAHIERPLFSLSCADIGTEPLDVENNLIMWSKRARSWRAVMLIDEADIYLERRSVTDLTRNNLVASFLRALEYFRGILFLTTNRVGIFDEAFISRIHFSIHYPSLQSDERYKVWNGFFEHLQRQRENSMRIHRETKIFVREDEDLVKLEWNGREIRNAFSVAVALAEAENDQDEDGRIVIKPSHIQASVHMSRSFKDYLETVSGKDESGMAAHMRLRNDSYGVPPPQTPRGGYR